MKASPQENKPTYKDHIQKRSIYISAMLWKRFWVFFILNIHIEVTLKLLYACTKGALVDLWCPPMLYYTFPLGMEQRRRTVTTASLGNGGKIWEEKKVGEKKNARSWIIEQITFVWFQGEWARPHDRERERFTPYLSKPCLVHGKPTGRGIYDQPRQRQHLSESNEWIHSNRPSGAY